MTAANRSRPRCLDGNIIPYRRHCHPYKNMVTQGPRESQEVKKILVQFLKLHLNNFHLCRSSLQYFMSRKTHNGLWLLYKVAFQSRASWSNEWPKIEQAKGPSPDHMLKWNNLQAMVSRAETMKNLTLRGEKKHYDGKKPKYNLWLPGSNAWDPVSVIHHSMIGQDFPFAANQAVIWGHLKSLPIKDMLQDLNSCI